MAQYFENPLGTNAEARATSTHGIPGASAKVGIEGQQAGPHGSNKREVGTYELMEDGKTRVKDRPQLHIFDRLEKTRTIGTMVIFAKHSITLSPEAKLQLSALVPDLMGKPNKVEVRGHAVRGSLPKDSAYHNLWEVSFARSITVMEYLTAHGIEADRIRLSQDAAFEPYSDEQNEVEDPRNARVEVYAVDELSYKFKKTAEQRGGDFVPAQDQPAPTGHDAAHGAESHGHGGGHGSSHGSGHGSSHGGVHGAKAESGHGAKASSHGAKADAGHGSAHGAKPAAHGKATDSHGKSSGHGH
ncbi:MAG: hypothetical protein B7Z55_09855 [Planctomycetales bacterium 12-60-4]|nr:MAG: hypothetical protein B7Z55_09855 [Planctomycetales bacterium 12-60-4]